MSKENEGVLREKQKQFNQLMRAMSTLIGEVDSDELHVAAFTAYNTVNQHESDDIELRHFTIASTQFIETGKLWQGSLARLSQTYSPL